jgi:CDP-glycerol glycerophosphotransferase (TagB/SpsB family)
MNLIKKFIFFFFLKKNLIKKIGFYINEEHIFNHYFNLFKKLNPNTFDIILADKFKNNKYKKFKDKLESYSWNVVFLKDIFLISKYKILVTHLYLGGNTLLPEDIFSKTKLIFYKFLNKIKKNSNKLSSEQYFQKKLGIYNIRFMYGVDIGGSTLGDYHNLFDEFFCHGPRDAGMLKEKFKGKIFEMGYPRYDDYLEISEKKKDILKKFLCDPKKPTIVWLCTTSEYFSSVISCHKYVEKLASEFNIILRPHPIEIDPQYDRYNNEVHRIIKSSKLIVNIDPFQNMSELYAISDLMLCDYGGTIFSSLYMNKKIILLNHRDAILDSNTNSTTSIEVRKYLPSIDEKDFKNSEEIIKKYLFSKKNMTAIKKTRLIYFGNKEIGMCSNLVRDRLNQLINSI